ncbi:MAG: extracellular solute-binding protein, partial [Gemmatimonadota bacterium]
ALGGSRPLVAQSAPLAGPLVVFNAGSLAIPFRELLRAFAARHPGVVPAQENSGSVEAARKITELGKVPDVLGVADYGVIAKLLIPQHATWYGTFARNAMVLAYTSRSTGAGEIDGRNWWQVVTRPGVRMGRADPTLDPNGYRTLLVFQLAERYYRQPGLARRLLAAAPARFVRPKEADLTALLQAGELDYAWTYRSIASSVGLKWVSLPPEIDLSDPAHAADYAQSVVKVPRSARASADSLEFRGEPIVYALTVPLRAPHRATADAFVEFVFGPEGRAILQKAGFILLEKPAIVGKR